MNSAVYTIPSDVRDTFSLLRSMIAEYCLNISHPISTLKGRPFATKNTMGMITPLLLRSNKTCFLTDVFWRPVAPINMMLFTGKVGKIFLPSF